MREIRFRAWNNSGKYFHPLDDDGDYFFRDDGDGLYLEDKHGKCKDTVLLQYTGLKDRNGKEIYEGDVMTQANDYGITYRFGRAGIVSYESDCGCFIVSLPGCNKNQHHEFLTCDIAFECKVIGNTYENPELLTTPPSV
jgi:uncharacterized phage protein (TIGR01671 family)